MKSPLPQSAIPIPKSPRRLLFAAIATLILPVAVAASEARHPDAVTVFHCTFDDECDVNYDGWPDRWVRKTGAGYPPYVQVEIKNDATAVDHKCLRMDLDGAAAAVESPPIRVMSRFSYELEAQLKNEALEHSEVVITLSFCDSAGRVLQTERSEPVSTTKGWQKVQIGRVEPADPAVDRVIMGLQVVRAAKGDLQGQVSLGDVSLVRYPRIDVSTNNPCNVYTDLDGVEIRCALSGIRDRDPEIHFQLLDASNRELQSTSYPLKGQLIVNKLARDGQATEGGDGPDGYEGTTTWQPQIPDYGFYRVVVRMMSSKPAADHADSDRQLGSREIDLVVVPPLPMPRQGEFGWTLPDGDQPLSFQDMGRLLPQVGINWVKLPVWFDANNPRRGDELIRFVELMGASNIDVVGIIDLPPSGAKSSAIQRDIPIADVLTSDTSAWSALLEPVMTRLSLRVRWWQLGRDDDASFAGSADLNQRIDGVRTALFRFGQDVHMGMSWNWDGANMHVGKVAWDFQQLRLDEYPSEKKFNELLAKPPENSAQRWVLVEPPPRADAQGQASKEIRAARASEFVHKLVAAKVHGADAIIVPHPFNDKNGLLRANGMPDELLLPWRTTAAMLGDAEYLGQLQLPGSSENRVFLRSDGQVVMVIWNYTPTTEVLYLGNEIRSVDLFGCTKPAKLVGREQSIDVGPTPTFVLGLHEAITRWRMSVAFEKNKVPSVFSKPHHNSLYFRNFFPQGVGGSLKLVVLQDGAAGESAANKSGAGTSAFMLDRWTIEPPQGTFQLPTNGETKFPFDIKLKDARYGTQPVRIDFKIEADELLEFSVYQDMEVGTEDLLLDVRSRLDNDGTLVVEQFMKNRTGRLADFKCYLRAGGRRPQRMQVYRLGTDLDRKLYRFADGDELVGKEMLLELEELNGPRVLQYRFVATAKSESFEESDETPAKMSDDKPVAGHPADSPSPLASSDRND